MGYHLRGPLSQRRVDAINRAFDILDTNRNSVIELEEIYSKYNAKEHPEVKSAKRTEEDVLREFLDTFDGGVKDGRVTREEFQRYYAEVSASIDTDEYFEQMMESAWRDRSGSRRGVAFKT